MLGNLYGTKESNGLINPSLYHDVPISKTVEWNTPGLKVTRLRLLSDPGFPVWDVSYCHGELNGERVRVSLPFDQLPKGAVTTSIIRHAARDGVYAKGLGILSNISTLN